MQVTIQREQGSSTDAAYVELDLLDGTTLRTTPMNPERAAEVKAELERRLFEIRQGVLDGYRDRM